MKKHNNDDQKFYEPPKPLLSFKLLKIVVANKVVILSNVHVWNDDSLFDL